jgi:two-component system OmpR family response regulator
MRILVVEDEPQLGNQIANGFREERHIVDLVTNGDSALAHLIAPDNVGYDAVVLDVMLPGQDGFAVCREIRRRGVRVPILMLTARNAVDDRVRGLDVGADDYLTKPFAFAELVARLRALARREPSLHMGPLKVADLALDPIMNRVTRGDRVLTLTAREYAIVELLMRNSPRVLTRDQIAVGAWDRDADHASNVIDVFIKNLRKKIDDPEPVKLLQTVRGVGYTLRPPHAWAAAAGTHKSVSGPEVQ